MRNGDSNKRHIIAQYAVSTVLITGISVAIYFTANKLVSYIQNLH